MVAVYLSLFKNIPPAQETEGDSARMRQSAAARRLLKRAAAEQFGADIDLLQMEYGPHGKPFFAGRPEIHFNISHTASAAAVAVAETEVGIDLEEIRPFSARFAERFLSEFLNPEQFTDREATAAWTKLESRIKLYGKSFSTAPPAHHCYFQEFLFHEHIVTLCTKEVLSLQDIQLIELPAGRR